MPALSENDAADADLEQMSDDALARLEDQLLLVAELDLSPRAQFTAGRVVVWVLTLIGVGIALTLYARLPTEKFGVLNIPLYLGALGVGAGAAHLLWRASGRRVREITRWLLHSWPLLIYLGATLYRFVHRAG
jgi:hypothetical protein